MSYDLNFWRYREGATHNHDKVYTAACCDGEVLPELEELPIGDILQRIAAAFPHWDASSPTDYENPGGGAFQITTTPQTVRIDCYGVSGDDMNRLMDILIDFGCPLYDPQVSERFDAWTDR